MCGKANATTNAKIEGSTMTVCQACSAFGKVLIPPKSHNQSIKFRKASDPIPEETILVADCGRRIRNARESRDMSQMMLARALAEKESLIQQVESGHTRPSERLAKKLERYLGIKLYEKLKKQEFSNQGKAGGLTIGDLIKK